MVNMDILAEEWKDIPGFENFYEVSNLGKVRGKTRSVIKIYDDLRTIKQTYKARVLNGHKNKEGYTYFALSNNGKIYRYCIATLILTAFVGPRPQDKEACHNDGNNQNDTLSNLRWDTHQNNVNDRILHGTYKNGQDHHMAKLTEEKARDIFFSSDRGVDIARKYDIAPATVSAIKKKRIWKSLHKLEEKMEQHV